MKNAACFLISWLFLWAVAVSARADDTLREWIAKGCPSPDREWQAKDYAALHKLLAGGTLPLPRLESEAGRAILHRLVDTANLSFYHNRKLPLQVRFPDLMNLMDAEKSMMMLFLRAANAGEKVEKELADLMVFQLAGARTMIELTDEFLPTIPKDDRYEIRMAGLAKMKSGLTTVLDGTLTSLTERAFYSDESIAKMARGVRENYPSFAAIVPDTAKAEFRVKIRDMSAKETNSEVKREFVLLEDAMKGELSGAVKGSPQPAAGSH